MTEFKKGDIVKLDTGASAKAFASIGLRDNTEHKIKEVVGKRVILSGYSTHQIDEKWLILVRRAKQ